MSCSDLSVYPVTGFSVDSYKNNSWKMWPIGWALPLFNPSKGSAFLSYAIENLSLSYWRSTSFYTTNAANLSLTLSSLPLVERPTHLSSVSIFFCWYSLKVRLIESVLYLGNPTCNFLAPSRIICDLTAQVIILSLLPLSPYSSTLLFSIFQQHAKNCVLWIKTASQ